jgi:hypothetical protein
MGYLECWKDGLEFGEKKVYEKSTVLDLLRCDFCGVYVLNSWDYCGWIELWDFSITKSNLASFFFLFLGGGGLV